MGVAMDFSGWIPGRIDWQANEPLLEWVHLGAQPLIDPFYGETLDGCVRHPAGMLFRHRTALEDLPAIAETQPALPMAGFIFHMSRCGSTLLCQMLAGVAQNSVISEPAPIDEVLRARVRDHRIAAERCGRWFRALMRILAWRRTAAQERAFFKFDCWHTLFLPMIRREFPDVPWIFVFRNPLEVVVSHAKRRGAHMIPGVLEPAMFGWDTSEIARMRPDEYGVRVLGRICEAALDQLRSDLGPGAALPVDYRQLPRAIWPALEAHWKLAFTASQTDQIMAAARLDAKNPVLPFEPDSQEKRARATPELREISHEWLDGPHAQLEALARARWPAFAPNMGPAKDSGVAPGAGEELAEREGFEPSKGF